MTPPSIAFIGGGQMAGALIRGLLRAGRAATDIVVLEPDAAQRARLTETLGVQTLATAGPALAGADMVVWAVKPQVLPQAIREAAASLARPLHVSIVAGISSAALAAWLHSERVVRAMPNTPALVGAGVTGLLALAGVDAADRDAAQALFAATGHTFWVESDERIDAVTALSGSGPGYVFQFLACLQDAAQSLGFDEAQARELVLRTAAGAIEQARSDATPLVTLRDRVTSKGGTTEAGLKVLAQHQLPVAVTQAMASAYERAQALSRELEA